MKQLFLYFLAISAFPRVMFASVLVGKTEGSFSISPYGAATYTIPIKIQKGLSDFTPEISLSYNSQTNNGIAGLGWNISGLSAISIVPKNIYFDSHAEAIQRGGNNAYVLDGTRLLLKSGVNGQTGATYRTENEQYSIISITSTSNGTPRTFQIKTTDGTTYKYGSSSGRYVLSNGETYQWALDYAEDILGNYISYSYSQEGALYPLSITYGHNIHGTNGVNCVVSFNYESRPDSISSYMFGYQSFFKKRLKSIVCKYNGNTYRTYTLNYSEDTFSRLTSVTESGISSSSLPPTTFEWKIPQFQVTCNNRSLETALLENPDDEYFFSGDLDGDGITEIINIGFREDVIGNTHWPYTVFWGRKWNPENQRFEFCYSAQTQSGFQMDSIFKTQKAGGLVMHASPGEGNSLVFPFCRIYNGSKAFIFTFPREEWNFSIPMNGTSEDIPPYTIFDVDKNGYDDIFIIEKDNNGTTYPAYLASCNLTTGSYSVSSLYFDLQGVPDRVLCADFNSDGMADLLITTSTGYYIYWNRSGSFSNTDRSYGAAFGKCDILETGDFNGDGLPDLIINKHNSTQWYIARNTGNDANGYFVLQEISYLSQAGAQNIAGKEKKLYCIVQDIDGNGKSDAIVGYPYSYGDGGHLCILKSNGSALTIYGSYDFPNSGDFPDAAHIVSGNFDGYGGMEIMYWGKALGQNTTGWHQLKNPSVKASSQKIISITDGLGAKDSISYGLLTDRDVYSVTHHHAFPLIRMAGSFPVVTSRTESITTDSRTTSYSYANGILHLLGKGFLGFEDIRTESSTGIVTDTHSVLDSTYYVLLPDNTMQSNTSGTQIYWDLTRVFLQGIAPHSYKIIQRNHRTEKLLDGYREFNECWDFENGFPTCQELSNDIFCIDKEITYWESQQNDVWIKGLPEIIHISKSGNNLIGDSIFETIIYERNPSNGLLLKETKKRGEDVVCTDGYSYNEYGQMTSHYTVPYNSTDTLVTRYEYYSTGRLKKVYDPKGLSKTYHYNSSYGTLTSFNDFNGVTTLFLYDGLFRETSRRTAIESCQTQRAFSDYGGGVYFVRQNITGKTPVISYYDAWERKIAESSYLADGSLMYQDYQYLSNGKIGFVSFPHKRTEAASGGTTYTYDNVQRLRSKVDSNGKTSTWSYSAAQVTSCIDGVTTTTDYYAEDVLFMVSDSTGWIAYDYNADGEIGLISNSEDYETSYTYDSYGRLAQTTDMNGVTKIYSYDSNGYPYRTTTNGSILETNYDKYGILRSKSWSEPNELPHTVNYMYDNRFRLIRETGDGYQNTYSYDQYGRITHKCNSITGNQSESLDVSIQYGSDNHVSNSVCYFSSIPTQIPEQYSYSYGYKVSDVLNDTLVWSLTGQDKWGHTTEEEDFLGNTSYLFNDYGNMLYVDRSADYSVGETYTYDIQRGNMIRKNNVPFSYDSLNQLTGWYNYTYSYDCMGNITHQPLVGTFSYDGFRVTDMLTESNLNLDDSLRIRYYKSIERPRSIENELYKADFYYDGNGDRFMMKVYKKEAWGTHLSFTRYYLADNAEVTVDTLGHYSHLYYAGGDAYTAPAVMVIDENENSSIYEITRDNLGSAILYENVAGNYYQNSYSPWGVRTYIGESTVFYRPGEEPGFGPFYRTYTGHEDLWMFGLLNANARLYSPYLGRFVSPDPLLAEDGSPLDFNPYVYARNNPYRYIDRNGEFWWVAAFALIGGGLNVWSNWDSINNAGDFLGFFAIGAASSALMSMAGVPAGFVQGFAVGASLGVASNLIQGAMNELFMGVPFNIDSKSLLIQAGISGIAGGITGGIQAKMNNRGFWTNASKVKTSNCPKSILTNYNSLNKNIDIPDESIGGNSQSLNNDYYIDSNDPAYLDLLKNAQDQYPKKAGHMERHHVDPKYMGGDPKGQTILLDGAYHQVITNEFRSIRSYNLDKLNENIRKDIMRQVYKKYPLPKSK